MKRRVIYGESNYARIVRERGYFVDKTEYIALLESIKNPVFLRPRRIGKSLFCSVLRYYYDLNYAGNFDELFGRTWIGRHPTPSHNQYILLFFNFSVVHVGRSVAEIEHSFKNHCNLAIDGLLDDIYRDHEFDPAARREIDALIKSNYKASQIIKIERR